jgi:hypothetical protein
MRPTTPQAERLLRYFEFDHLPEPLQEISAVFKDAAERIASIEATYPAEQTVALRKLLEAKDAAVRCALT